MGLASDTEGDYENFLMAMGIDADMIDAIDAVGGPPSLGDMRDAIERSTFEELVEAREAMRAGVRECVARLPLCVVTDPDLRVVEIRRATHRMRAGVRIGQRSCDWAPRRTGGCTRPRAQFCRGFGSWLTVSRPGTRRVALW